jgi:DNA-directed RNA polymerase subunit RPC12/RpoP
MNCKAAHTKYQPSDEEWFCPKCGDGAESFVIEESDSDSDECEKLHNNDGLICYNCGHSESGKVFSSRAARKSNMVPCPHCKGKGFVKRAGT